MFLLVELYLCTHQPQKAMGMIGFIEKYVINGGKSGSPDKDESAIEIYRTKIGQVHLTVFGE